MKYQGHSEPKTVKLRYAEIGDGLTDSEKEVVFEIEGRTISLFAPLNSIDSKNDIVVVLEVGGNGEYVVIELPGEPLNTPRRLEVTRRWLEGAAVA
jgi:hypothetical protein